MAVQLDPDIELKRAMSEQAAWGGQAPVASAGTAAAAAAAAAGSSGEGKGAAGKVRCFCVCEWVCCACMVLSTTCLLQQSKGCCLTLLRTTQ
jgi:hypothetical protein